MGRAANTSIADASCNGNDLIGCIGMDQPDHRSRDILGRVYEYFLSQFASAEGKKGGQFYTPRCVVRLLVEMLAPYRGRVYDPCCGSGGMFVLPAQLFYSTQIPVCLWFLAREKKNGRFRDRRRHGLFIEARQMGTTIDRVQRTLTDNDIARRASRYVAAKVALCVLAAHGGC